MRAVGIIAEYNPFHNGHAYQIEQIRQHTGADFCVVAMSGNFLQRGTPAIVDKFARSEMALNAGADLVLELPVVHSTASAEFFAGGGVTLLASTGIVDTVCYGLERPHPGLMRDIVEILANPDTRFHSLLSEELRLGASFPAARQSALTALLPQYRAEEITEFLSSPNNILALEYEKAIVRWNAESEHKLSGFGIKRIGDAYHETQPHSEYSSATAIRHMLLSEKNQDAQNFSPTDIPATFPFDLLSRYLPNTSLRLLEAAAGQNLLMETDDFSSALYTALLRQRRDGYEAYADCSLELSNRIASKLREFDGFTKFCELLKTKEITHTRISRVLSHILLDIKKEDYTPSSVPYFRVLGFRRDSKALLSEISKKASAPLITKVADASSILSESAMNKLQKDIYAADLYRGISCIKSGRPLCDEYTHQLVIL